MMIDYKFWYIKRDDDGKITEAGVRFYEGDITTEGEIEPSSKLSAPITRFRKVKQLNKNDLSFLGSVVFGKENTINDAVIYSEKDFGNIYTDNELNKFLDLEISKDKTRVAINNFKN